MRFNLTTKEFGDFVAAFLYDKLSNPDAVLPPEVAEDFDDLAQVMKRKGMKSILLSYYLSMDPQMRVKYRMCRDVFRPRKKGQKSVLIEIHWEPMPVDADKPGILTKIGRKVGRLLKKYLTGQFKEEE